MKQTNNAIKFLMAQYRAIFKNAYFKGIASAVLLTAGLASAGTANAVLQDFYYYSNSNWIDYPTNNATSIIQSDGIAAGTIAGDGLSGSTIKTEQAATVASGGNLVIGNSSGANLGAMTSGQAAGGWAQAANTSTVGVAAIGNSVTVNGTGYVSGAAATSSRGRIVGGYARANGATAEASNNTVTISKGENGATAAASRSIFGGFTQSSKGGTANDNQVIITGKDATTRQVVASISGDGVMVANVLASGASATGVYTANNNEAILNFISVDTAATDGLVIYGSRIELGGSSGSASSSNSYIELNDSVIKTASGGTIAATNISNGSGAITVDGNNRGLKITKSSLANSGDNVLTLAGTRVDVGSSTSAVKVTNSTITLDQVSLANGKTTNKNEIVAASVNSKGDVVASNNSVNITESAQNIANESTYLRDLNTFVTAARIENTQSSLGSTIAIDASNNSVTIGANTKINGSVFGARVTASSGSLVESLNLNNNSVTIAGQVKGDVYSASFDSLDDSKVSGTASFLNNAIPHNIVD